MSKKNPAPHAQATSSWTREQPLLAMLLGFILGSLIAVSIYQLLKTPAPPLAVVPPPLPSPLVPAKVIAKSPVPTPAYNFPWAIIYWDFCDPASLTKKLAAEQAKFDHEPVLSPATGWEIKDNVLKCTALREKMPSHSLTLAATFVLNRTQEWDGITGFWQDNENFKKGYYLGANNGKVYIAVSIDGKMLAAASPEPIRLGDVTHACGTWDGAMLRLFLNGTEVASVPMTGYAELPPDTDFTAGGYHDSNDRRPFNGFLRNVYLSNQAASASEVKKMAAQSRRSSTE